MKRSMQTEGKIYLPIVIVFGIATVLYIFFGKVDGRVEMAGTTALTLSFLMAIMLWGAFWVHGRTLDPRPEDDLDAEVADGAGELAFFPPSSIWPFWCAVTASLIFLGIILGWWISLIGVGVGIWAVSGWCYQYYRGVYRH